MPKEIIVHDEGEETSVAVLEDGRLAEFYVERPLTLRVVGNIYKGKIENILPGMQAAFVDIGLDKNAFLYIHDVLPKKARRKRHTITQLLKKGQNIILQVVKEPFGTKGPRVTTNVTIPGRYAVLMPRMDYIGVSRRIQKEEERLRLRKTAQMFKSSRMGVIVRTAAEGISEEELAHDIKSLQRLWRKISAKSMKVTAPALLHKDLGLTQRILRDLFTEEVFRLVISSEDTHERVLDLLEITAPDLCSKIELYRDEDIMDKFGITEQVDQALKRKVWLRCGGHIVIDQVEALTSIDVNTGKYVGTTDSLSDTVLKTNLEAAVEIARQLRLRNVGGIIIIDFIDMDKEEDQKRLLAALEKELKKDKTKTNVLGLTNLGLVEMTRKKARLGLEGFLQKDCPYCQGSGKVMSEETVSLQAKKELAQLARKTDAAGLLLEAHPSVAGFLIGSGGTRLRRLEKNLQKQIIVRGFEQLHLEDFKISKIGSKKELAFLVSPFMPGQVMKVRIEEMHINNSYDGVARINGFILDVEGGGKLVGQEVKIEITRVFRTFARARLAEEQK